MHALSARRSTPLLALALAIGCAAPDDVIVSAGVAHACELHHGSVRCWGDDRAGQLGRGAPSDVVGAPAALALPEVIALDAGGDTTCVVDTAASVWCFGANRHGQLGDGTRLPRGVAAIVTALPPIDRVSVGLDHACALAQDGSILCWGWNGSGQSAPGGPLDVGVPSRVDVPPARAVEAGYNDTCAITIDDRAICWGALTGGPTELARDVRAIAIGVDHVCVSRASEVRCFGAEPGGARPPLPVDGRAFALEGGDAASGAVDHACVTDARGALYCLGKNERGQLGDGSLRSSSELVAVRGLDGAVTSVSVGHEHSCAVSGGRTWCWGGNDRGELGEPGAPTSLEPVLVP